MERTNNDYLKLSADSLDPSGMTSERQLNIDYLSRIATALEGGVVLDGSSIETKLDVVTPSAIDVMFKEGS